MNRLKIGLTTAVLACSLATATPAFAKKPVVNGAGNIAQQVCKNFANLGFKNQGQCVKFIVSILKP